MELPVPGPAFLPGAGSARSLFYKYRSNSKMVLPRLEVPPISRSTHFPRPRQVSTSPASTALSALPQGRWFTITRPPRISCLFATEDAYRKKRVRYFLDWLEVRFRKMLEHTNREYQWVA